VVEQDRKAFAKRGDLAGKDGKGGRKIEVPPFDQRVLEIGEGGTELGIVENGAATATDRLDLEVRNALREAYEVVLARRRGAAFCVFGCAHLCAGTPRHGWHGEWWRES
jgi:hypothetical protein